MAALPLVFSNSSLAAWFKNTANNPKTHRPFGFLLVTQVGALILVPQNYLILGSQYINIQKSMLVRWAFISIA